MSNNLGFQMSTTFAGMISAVSMANIAACIAENYARTNNGSTLHLVWVSALTVTVMQFWWGMQKLQNVPFDRFWKALVLVLPDVLLFWCTCLLCQMPIQLGGQSPDPLCQCTAMARMHILYLLLGLTFSLTLIEYGILRGVRDKANWVRGSGIVCFLLLSLLSWPKEHNGVSKMTSSVHTLIGVLFLIGMLVVAFSDHPPKRARY